MNNLSLEQKNVLPVVVASNIGLNKIDRVDKPIPKTETHETKHTTINEEQKQELKDFYQKQNIQIKFSTDTKTGQSVVSFLDKNSEVIRQIPTPEMLKISESISQFLKSKDNSADIKPTGIIINEKA